MREQILRILEDINPVIISYTGDTMLLDGTIDSFEMIDIVSELEEEFGIEIDAELVVAENFANKETIIELMSKLLGE